MTATLTHYVQGCSTYPPRGRWTDIATDLITGLPDATYQSRSVNAVLTIVDKFSNRTHFYAVSAKLARWILLTSSSNLGHFTWPSRSIESDRGPQFTSAAFKCISQLNVDSQLSLARHRNEI
ncbi:hypothetical protein E0198_003548 [Clavispora lusitaniae]|nr:hypothetical protein E0198_003548 [Clavispora lusitaniae]